MAPLMPAPLKVEPPPVKKVLATVPKYWDVGFVLEISPRINGTFNLNIYGNVPMWHKTTGSYMTCMRPTLTINYEMLISPKNIESLAEYVTKQIIDRLHSHEMQHPPLSKYDRWERVWPTRISFVPTIIDPMWKIEMPQVLEKW